MKDVPFIEVRGPVTVANVEDHRTMVRGIRNKDRAPLYAVEFYERVLLAVADGHPRSAAIAKAALRAFDV